MTTITITIKIEAPEGAKVSIAQEADEQSSPPARGPRPGASRGGGSGGSGGSGGKRGRGKDRPASSPQQRMVLGRAHDAGWDVKSDEFRDLLMRVAGVATVQGLTSGGVDDVLAAVAKYGPRDDLPF